MSESRFFSQPMDAVSEIDQLYEDICNGIKDKITYANVYKVLADKLAITEESLSHSEILENKILHFILSLSIDCCKALPRDIDMTGRAQWALVNRKALGGAAIDITFSQFTLQHAEELADAINQKYGQIAMVPFLVPKEMAATMSENDYLLSMRWRMQQLSLGKENLIATPTISLHLGKFFKDVLPHIPVPRPSYGLGF